MATSGTVGRTIIDTASILEHAFRRCRISPSAQTPETIQTAKDNLYFLMLDIGNRGLNLWAVDKIFVGVNENRPGYVMPLGTLSVLNVIYSQPTLAAGTFAQTLSGGDFTLTVPSKVLRVGFQLNTAYTGKITIQGSADGITYETLTTTPEGAFSVGSYQWVELPIAGQFSALRVASGDTPALPIDIINIQAATVIYDLPCTPWNRDTYMALNAKSQTGRPSTNYFFEKKLTPSLTLWPVPNNDLDHLTLYVHRQSQDVGKLTEQIEIPQRWLDGIIWMLAARLCFELPAVDPSLMQMIVGMADKQELEAEQAESDGLPIYLQPNMACYNR